MRVLGLCVEAKQSFGDLPMKWKGDVGEFPKMEVVSSFLMEGEDALGKMALYH